MSAKMNPIKIVGFGTIVWGKYAFKLSETLTDILECKTDQKKWDEYCYKTLAGTSQGVEIIQMANIEHAEGRVVLSNDDLHFRSKQTNEQAYFTIEKKVHGKYDEVGYDIAIYLPKGNEPISTRVVSYTKWVNGPRIMTEILTKQFRYLISVGSE